MYPTVYLLSLFIYLTRYSYFKLNSTPKDKSQLPSPPHFFILHKWYHQLFKLETWESSLIPKLCSQPTQTRCPIYQQIWAILPQNYMSPSTFLLLHFHCYLFANETSKWINQCSYNNKFHVLVNVIKEASWMVFRERWRGAHLLCREINLRILCLSWDLNAEK